MIAKLSKYKKILLPLLTLVLIFIIYTVNLDKRIRYVPLGDSVAAGQNPYGEISYGYTDYVASYLSKNGLLKEYIKGYAVSGYRTKDVINDIENGKIIIQDGKEKNIKKALRESNLVTISIGANDFLEKLNQERREFTLPNIENLKKLVDEVTEEVDKTLSVIRKYAKGRVIVVGYYNPLPRLFESKEKELDEIFAYVREEYKKICKKNKVDYIDIYEVMKEEKDCLPNPFDIHPSTRGYELIAKEIINFLEDN